MDNKIELRYPAAKAGHRDRAKAFCSYRLTKNFIFIKHGGEVVDLQPNMRVRVGGQMKFNRKTGRRVPFMDFATWQIGPGQLKRIEKLEAAR